MLVAKLRAGRALVVGRNVIRIVECRGHRARIDVIRPSSMNAVAEVRWYRAGEELELLGPVMCRVDWARRGEVKLVIDAPPDIDISKRPAAGTTLPAAAVRPDNLPF